VLFSTRPPFFFSSSLTMTDSTPIINKTSATANSPILNKFWCTVYDVKHSNKTVVEAPIKNIFETGLDKTSNPQDCIHFLSGVPEAGLLIPVKEVGKPIRLGVVHHIFNENCSPEPRRTPVTTFTAFLVSITNLVSHASSRFPRTLATKSRLMTSIIVTWTPLGI